MKKIEKVRDWFHVCEVSALKKDLGKYIQLSTLIERIVRNGVIMMYKCVQGIEKIDIDRYRYLANQP